MIKLLVVDNYDSFTFNLVQIIEQSSLCEFDVIKNDNINLSGIDQYDKIIFSPGPGVPSENPIMEKIIKNYSLSKSILGVCLGFQAIAEYYGAKLINMNSVLHGITKEISLIDQSEYLFADLPKNISVGLYHSWEVSSEDFPNELKITALSDDGIIIALKHKALDIKGVQFHPESIMTPFGKKILFNWLAHQKS